MNPNNNIPPHKILDVAKNASIIEIKDKYKDLVKKIHPDRYKGSKLYANQQFSQINQAYQTMISPEYQRIKNFSYQRGVFHPNRNIHRQTLQRQQQQVLQRQRQRQRQRQTINQYSFPHNRRDPHVLCNGTVLFSGNFHPSNLSYDTLKKMRENI